MTVQSAFDERVTGACVLLAEVAGVNLLASGDSTQGITARYGTFICRIITNLWEPSLHELPFCSHSVTWEPS